MGRDVLSVPGPLHIMQTVAMYPGDRAKVRGEVSIVATAEPGLRNAIKVDVLKRPRGHGKVRTVSTWHRLAESSNGRAKRAEISTAGGADIRVSAIGDNRNRNAGKVLITADEITFGAVRPRSARDDAALDQAIEKEAPETELLFVEAAAQCARLCDLYAKRGRDARTLANSFVSRLRRALHGV